MLAPLPPGFTETRLRLHRLAEEVLKPARERVNGRFGLRALPGGFGTPPFGDVMQVHVDGVELVTRDGEEVSREPIDGVDPDAAAALAAWFAFVTGVVEELRADAPAELAATPPQLWPEHFDVAIELGSEEGGQRAAYGGSPGDEEHEEPYLYVAPWDRDAHELTELQYADLLAAPDRRMAALKFFAARRAELNG
jgi:hypothetical protein